MATDGRGTTFSRAVQKHAGRAKERLLQNLGKADKTTDEIFDVYVNNFTKQQNVATRLHKEFRNYVASVKAMQLASKNLMELLTEIYEEEWIGHEIIPVKTQTLEMLWEDFFHKLNDQITIPLNTYMNQFPEIRGKIAKRGRKLVDYDSCRHNLESLKHNTKKRDELKIAKAKEQLEDSKRMYEVVNNELYDSLPAIYDSRIPFLVSNLQTLFTAEAVFHSENAKVFSHLSEITEHLATESQKGTYLGRKPGSPLSRRDTFNRQYEEIDYRKSPTSKERMSDHMNEVIQVTVSETNGDAVGISSSTPSRTEKRAGLETSVPNASPRLSVSRKVDKEYEPVQVGSQDDEVISAPEQTSENNQTDPDACQEPPLLNERTHTRRESSKIDSAAEPKKVEELYDIPVGATTTDLPAGVLYRVRATFKYVAEDVDELSFETGELIRVIEYEDPEEQEEGWLMGMKESTGERGLFPANFTRPI